MTDHAEGSLDALARAQLGTRFAFERLIHRGEGSAVYLVQAPNGFHGPAPIALKVVAWPKVSRRQARPAFLRWAERAATLRHPQIVPVLDSGATEDFGWYAMEYQHGESLAQRLQRDAHLELEQCRHVVLQIAAALDYAHGKGVTHGSLKPGDIFVDAARWVRVSDFGLRQALAPERGQAGPETSADQYALACLVQACVGVSLHDDREDFLPLRAALTRAMDPQRSAAYPTMTEFAVALEGGRRPRELDARAPSHVKEWNQRMQMLDWEPPGGPRLTRRLAVAIPALLVVLGLGGWVLVSAQGTGRDVAPVVEQRKPPDHPGSAAPEPAKRSPAVGARRPAVPGTLYLSSRPWGWIYLDGRRAGHTPVSGLDSPPGRHVLRIAREGFEPYERAIEVAAGQALRLTGIALKPQAR